MIVDDEPLIRRGLRETIEWDLLGLEVVAEACNGEEAFQIMEKVKPHIIITDVKMPVMDGISFIKKIDQLNLKVKTIILSGYNEYDYLKEAIQYNVESYLLKPINQEELIAILKSTILNIEKEFDIDMQHREGIHAIRNNTLNRLITHNISLKEFKDKSRMFHIPLSYGDNRVLVGVIDSYEEGYTEIWKQDNYLKLYSVMNICVEIIADDKGVVFTDNDGQIVMILENRDKGQLDKRIKEILHKVNKYLGISLVIGVGAVKPLEQIHESYQSALVCLQYGIITENDNILYANNQMFRTFNKVDDINYDLINTFIISKNGDKLAEYIQTYMTKLSKNNISIDHIRSNVIEIVTYVTRLMNDILQDKKVKLNRLKIEYSEILKINRLDVMIYWLITYCNNVITHIAYQTESKGSKLVQDVMEYIYSNYYNNISLKSLSGILDINTSYLGQIFKREMGTSFTEYVNKYRIHKAIDYLKETNMKVYEISEEVGYTNYQYFIKMFKKYTGQTPSDYKN